MTTREKFSEKAEEKNYVQFLANITAWSELAPAVTLKICEMVCSCHWLKSSLTSLYSKAAGLDDKAVVTHITGSIQERMRLEREARTGDTDSKDGENAGDTGDRNQMNNES